MNTSSSWTNRARIGVSLLVLSLVSFGLAGTAPAAWGVDDGTIEGTLLLPDGSPDADAYIYFTASDDPDISYSAQTGSNGSYSESLPPRQYIVQFASSDDDPDLQPEYYSNEHFPEDADRVTVVSGQTIGNIDGRPDQGGQVTGTISGPSGDDLDNLVVEASRLVDGAWTPYYADQSGSTSYTIRGLPTGTYRVCAYLERWYGCVGGDDVNSSDDISVTAPGTTSRNIIMHRKGHITGRVTDAAGDPISGVEVTLSESPSATGFIYDIALTGDDGTYGTYRLPGQYYLHFIAPDAWSSEYYDDQTVASDATPLTVTEGVTTEAADAVLAPASASPENTVAPTISGTRKVSSRLTANHGTWSPSSGVSYGYTWVSGSTVVAHGSQLVVPASLAHRALAVVVTATRNGHSATARSSSVSIAPGTFTFSRNPAIRGKAKVHKWLHFVPEAVSPAAVRHFQWLRGGHPIPNATGADYKLRKKDKRRHISLSVTYLRTGYVPATRVTGATRKVRQ